MPSKGGTIYSNLATLIYGRVPNRDYDTSPRICPLVDLIYTGFFYVTTRGRGLLDSKKFLSPLISHDLPKTRYAIPTALL